MEIILNQFLSLLIIFHFTFIFQPNTANADVMGKALQKRTHKLINPEIAADNFDKNLLDFGYPAFNIKQNAKNLLASLQKSTLNKLKEKSNINIDPTKIDFHSQDEAVEKEEKKNKEQEVKTELINKFSSKNKVSKEVVGPGETKENLDDFNLDFKDINENKDVNIFKIITNRYRKYFSEKKL